MLWHMAKRAISLSPSCRPEAGDAGDQERLRGVEAEFDIRVFSGPSYHRHNREEPR